MKKKKSVEGLLSKLKYKGQVYIKLKLITVQDIIRKKNRSRYMCKVNWSIHLILSKD